MAQANGRERADISSTVDQGTGEAEGKFEVVQELWQISPKGTIFFAKHVSKSRDLVLSWKILMLTLCFFMQGGGTAILGAGSNASGSSVGQGLESYDLFSILDRLARGEIIPQTV